MKYMEMMGHDSDTVNNLSKKLSPPLVTLLSSEPEVGDKLDPFNLESNFGNQNSSLFLRL
jgi:hypothetical protein